MRKNGEPRGIKAERDGIGKKIKGLNGFGKIRKGRIDIPRVLVFFRMFGTVAGMASVQRWENPPLIGKPTQARRLFCLSLALPFEGS